MRKPAFILAACALLTACNKDEQKFCYTCTHKVTYRATAQAVTYSVTRSDQYCDKTYKDIVVLERDNPGFETQDSTVYQLECVRQQ